MKKNPAKTYRGKTTGGGLQQPLLRCIRVNFMNAIMGYLCPVCNDLCLKQLSRFIRRPNI